MLKAKKLAKNFGSRLIFKNVDFELNPQSIHLLQGSNGVGKSTLFKILAGLLEADAGQIETGLTLDKVGYLAHASFMYPELTALENLTFWHSLLTKKSLEKQEYMAILEELSLAKFAHEKTRIFSRGMLQKLTLARLMAQKPSLYLLDEPSTGLDVQARKLLIEKILQAKQENACVFWISHDIENDKIFADYIHVLEDKTMHTEKLGA